MHWRNFYNNRMYSNLVIMVLLPWRSFQAQQYIFLLKSPHMGLSSLCLDAILKGNIGILPYWEPHYHVCIYLVHSQFTSVSVDLVIIPETGHISPRFNVVFYDKFPQFHSWGKAKYPQVGHILCKTAHKVAHQRILTSETLSSLHILRNIPENPQVMI